MSFEGAPQMSISDAMNTISAIEGMIVTMGANDSEPESIQLIKQNLESGVITPNEAVAQAEALREGKQDYH